MNTSITNYINSGTSLVKTFKQYAIVLMGPVMMLPINLLIGIVLGGFCKTFSIVMMGVCLLLVVVGLLLYTKENLVLKLWCQMFAVTHFLLQLVTVQTNLFVMTYGLHYSILLLQIPLLIVPAVTVYLDNRLLKKNDFLYQEPHIGWKSGIIVGSIVLHSIPLLDRANKMGTISQNGTILFVIIGILIVNSLFSLCYINFYKIYLATSIRGHQSGDGQSGNRSIRGRFRD